MLASLRQKGFGMLRLRWSAQSTKMIMPAISTRFMSSHVLPNDTTIGRITNTILDIGIDAKGSYYPLASAKQLAGEYRFDESFKTIDDKVKALVNNELKKSFGAGFVTGIGGVLTMLAGVPAALMTSWVLQARLTGTIAELYGHDSQEQTVRTKVLLSMLGDDTVFYREVNEKFLDNQENLMITKENMLVKTAAELGARIPMSVMGAMQRSAVKEMLKRGTAQSASKLVPFIGGLVGGTIDSFILHETAENAQKLFRC